MELYFLRHGLAGQHGDPQYKDDSLRPLTAEGKEKMHAISLGMQQLNLTFDTILSSPYVRAKQTAEIVAQSCQFKCIHLTNNLLPPASMDTILNEITGLFPKAKNILLVGHAPHLSQLVSELLGCSKPLNIGFKKGGLCGVHCDLSSKKVGSGLLWLLSPKQLVILSKVRP